VVIRFYYAHLLEDTSTFRDLLFINLLFLTNLLRLKHLKRYAEIRNLISLNLHHQIYNFLKNREWRKLHNEVLSDLYSLPNIVWVVKSRRMRWAGYMARMGQGERGVQGSGGET